MWCMSVQISSLGSNGPLMCGKQTTFEGGMRTPTIAWWSRGFLDMSHDGQRPEGRVSQYVGTQMDFLPTFADLAGARLPPDLRLDGQSLAAILLGKDENNLGHPVFFYRGNLLYAVRWTHYKVTKDCRVNRSFIFGRNSNSPLKVYIFIFLGTFLDMDNSSRRA